MRSCKSGAASPSSPDTIKTKPQRSRNSRLESESRPKNQNYCKRKGRTRSNTHAVPRLARTLHDGQRSHSSPRVKQKETASSQTIPDESVTCIAVKEDRHQNIMSSVVLKKGMGEPWASERVARFINSLGYKETDHVEKRHRAGNNCVQKSCG